MRLDSQSFSSQHCRYFCCCSLTKLRLTLRHHGLENTRLICPPLSPNQEYWSGLHFFLQCQRRVRTLTSTGRLSLVHDQDMCFIQSRAVEFLPWWQGQSILPSAGVVGMMGFPWGHCSLPWEARRRNGSMLMPHLLSAHQFLSLSWTPQAQFSLSAGA